MCHIDEGLKEAKWQTCSFSHFFLAKTGSFSSFELLFFHAFYTGGPFGRPLPVNGWGLVGSCAEYSFLPWRRGDNSAQSATLLSLPGIASLTTLAVS